MDEKQKPSKTIFVRNLPFSTTNEKLESIFGDIGPIRQCFVVKEKGSQTCRGFGYVKFSLLEDAVKAKETIKSFEGRKLSLSFADPKAKQDRKKKPKPVKEDEESDTEQTKDKTEPQKTESKDKIQTDNRNLIFRTVIVSGFSSSVTKDEIDNLFKTFEGLENTQYPEGKENQSASLKFKCVKDAKKAIRKLNGKTVKGQRLTAVQMSAHNEQSTPTVSKMARLIVRNLSFQCTESQLQKAFEKFGEITEVKIPEKPDGKKCGFGFVQFVDVETAQKAVSEMNTKPIGGRPVAVDWAIPKDKFMAANKKELEKKDNKDTETEVKPQEEKKISKTNDSVPTKTDPHKKAEVVADDEDDVEDDDNDDDDDDDVLSEEEEDESETDSKKESLSEDDKDDVLTSEDEGFDDDDDDSDDQEEDESDDEEEEDESDDDDELDQKKKKGKAKNLDKTDVEEGRTLFIRNVPFSISPEELKELFEEFGETVYCKLVMDSNLKRPKGTAFVQFKKKEDADRCLKKAETTAKEGGILISGRQLLVACAVSKKQAQEMSQKEKKKEKKDKRNLYLAREGLIRPGTQAAVGLSETDIGKRTKVFNQMQEKLKNPSIFISPTRLSVHNLPMYLDEKELKKVLLHAVSDRRAVLKECRIMRDLTRLNLKGVGKSRGFGFVEFTEHEHALKALHNLNNNPDIFKDHQRLIVHFSLENKQALAAKEKRLQRIKQRQEILKKTGQADVKNKPGDVKIVKKLGKSEEITQMNEQNKIAQELYKGPKGLPRHFGPKVRHKPRANSEIIEGKPKKRKTMSSLRREHDLKDMAPAVKKRKRGKPEVRDNFDKLVNKYKQQFIGAGTKRKWFDT